MNLDVNTDASATNRFTIDGHEFEATATGTADDNIIVATSTNDAAFDHGARAAVAFDQSTVTIHADSATNFDNTTVDVQKSALGATADSSNIIITDDIANGPLSKDVTLSISATANGAAPNDDNISFVINKGPTIGGTANYVGGELTITLDQADANIDATKLTNLIEGADFGGSPAGTPLFAVTFDPLELDAIDATAATTQGLDTASDPLLTREEVLATYTPGTNTLQLILNSDLTNVTTTDIKTAIDAITEFTTNKSTSISGPANIATANVTASSTYTSLVRPTTLASYQDTSASTNLIFTDAVGGGGGEITLGISATATGAASNDRPIDIDVVAGVSVPTSADYNSTTDRLTVTLDNANGLIAFGGGSGGIQYAIENATIDGGAAASQLFTATSTDLSTINGIACTHGLLTVGSDTQLLGGNTITVDFDDPNAAINFADVISAIDAVTEFSGTTSTSTSGTINGVNLLDNSTLSTLTRLTTGAAAFFNTTSDTLTLTVDGSNSAISNTNILSAINGLTQFNGTTATNAAGVLDGTTLTSTSGLATAAQVQDLVLRISGELGSEVFAFQAGATFDQISSAIQLVSDAIGVTANTVGSQLNLTSSNFGSKAFVGVEVISEGAGGTFETNLSAKRSTGADISARINGI